MAPSADDATRRRPTLWVAAIVVVLASAGLVAGTVIEAGSDRALASEAARAVIAAADAGDLELAEASAEEGVDDELRLSPEAAAAVERFAQHHLDMLEFYEPGTPDPMFTLDGVEVRGREDGRLLADVHILVSHGPPDVAASSGISSLGVAIDPEQSEVVQVLCYSDAPMGQDENGDPLTGWDDLSPC